MIRQAKSGQHYNLVNLPQFQQENAMQTICAPVCLHCDAALTNQELSGGWCDSCGKRLPSFPVLRAKDQGELAIPKRAKSEGVGNEGRGWRRASGRLLLFIALFILCSLAALFLVSST